MSFYIMFCVFVIGGLFGYCMGYQRAAKLALRTVDEWIKGRGER